MKKLTMTFTLVAIVAFAAVAAADVPQVLSYQGQLTDGAGNPESGVHSVTFAIYDVATGGTPIWSEVLSVAADADGLFDVILGEVSPLSGSTFDGADRWLGISVGSDPELIPRTRLVSVPYAYKADYAESSGSTVPDNDWDGVGSGILYNLSDDVGVGTDSPQGKLHVDTDDEGTAIFSRSITGGNGTAGYFEGGQIGVRGAVSGGNGYRHGIMGEVGGDANTIGHAVYGITNGGSSAIGVYGVGSAGSNATIGVAGRAEGAGGGNHTGVQGMGIQGASTNYGVEGLANGTGSVDNYGVKANAWGAADNNYGVYGEASGATSNWAGYFVGRVYVDGGIATGEGTGDGVRFGQKHASEEDLLPIVQCNSVMLSWYSSSHELYFTPLEGHAHYVICKNEGPGVVFESGLTDGSNTLAVLDSNGEFAIVDVTSESLDGGYIHLYCMYSNGHLTAHYHYRYE